MADPELKPLPPPDPSGGPLTLAYYIVAYVDLLGQSEALTQLRSLPKTDDEQRAASIAMMKTGRLIRQLRNTFTDLADRGNRVADGFLQELPNEERRQEYRRFATTNLFQTGFSDSFVIAMKLSPDGPVGEPVDHARVSNGIFRMLTSLAGVSLIALSSGVALRGGIDVHLGMDIYPNEVYGPVLLNAYRLESQSAEYPRTIIGDGVMNFLAQIRTTPADHPFLEVAHRVVDDIGLLINEADDGRWMLHFLSPLMRRAMGAEDFDNRWGHARKWIGEEIETYRASRNDKLKARYVRLARYFDAWKPQSTSPPQSPE